mgnify:CR=1 FL=1
MPQNGNQRNGLPNGAARVQPPQARPTIPHVDVPRPEPTQSAGIDDWLADLRRNQPPTPPPAPVEPEPQTKPYDDSGRHHRSADRPALSVRELLNRQKPQ